MFWFGGRAGRAGRVGRRAPARQARRLRPALEVVQPRTLPSVVPGVDYLISGYQWPNPSHITFSIVPDGVQWDHGITNLNATFNAAFGDGPWQHAIAEALATWESVANINICEVPDDGLPFDTPGLEQGDPRFGDIRIGGYPFPDNMTTLAQTYFPPPDAGTAAGDDDINTSMNFGVGDNYDLYSVMLHEMGLALGLGEVTNPTEVMYGVYMGIRTGLAAGDIAGIQAIYGPRTPDAYQSQGEGLAADNAIDLTSQLSASHQVTVSNLSLATIGDTEYFSVVAPSFPGATLQVTAAASNISLLSPQVTILNAAGQVLDTQGNPGAWGDNASAQTSQIVPGQSYTIAVTGATQDVFAVGTYQLDVNFAGDPSVAASASSPSLPSTTVSAPPTASSPVAAAPETAPAAPAPSDPDNALGQPAAQPTPLGTISATAIDLLSLGSGTAADSFIFQVKRAGVYRIAAPATSIRVLDGAGKLMGTGEGSVAVWLHREKTPFLLEISAAGGAPVADGSLSIVREGAAAPAMHAAHRIHHG